MTEGAPFTPCTMSKEQRAIFDIPPEIIKSCNEWIGAYYQSQIKSLTIKAEFYTGQLAITQQAFWIVAAISVCGLLFSAYQLVRATTFGMSEMEASLKSVKIRSAYVGVTVLVISLVFFFVFFTEVFRFTFTEPT